MHGIVIVNQPVVHINCSGGALSISLEGTPYTISPQYNTLVVTGCNSLILSTIGGCTATCDANSTDTTCNGVNCCQVEVPRMKEIHLTYQSIKASNNSFCGYVFLVDRKWYTGLVNDLSNPFNQEFGVAPLVLEWEFHWGEFLDDGVCLYCEQNSTNRYRNPDDYGCWFSVDVYDHHYRTTDHDSTDNSSDYASSIGYCSCLPGFDGNPFIVEGCSDVDECSNAALNDCAVGMDCINKIEGFSCHNTTGIYDYEDDENDGFRNNLKRASIVIGSVFGGLILVTAAWKMGKAVTEKIRASRKHMFFKRNGGILLEQLLAAIENGIEKTKLFGSVELAKATDDYNENRILGRGGEGVVYKGMLEDGKIVAVKQSERVNQCDVETFINEVVIVSQINHRNVVKLLGCCLKSKEVPRLVYEFVPNGTLFSHIHHPHEDFPLLWEMRVRIAKQVAGALAYLHSSASVPIFHRDIKSTNILLDEKYRAKISDFGTSRSVSLDQTHVTTRVVGTFGYLDPEYFQSNQFTEKSDVYSFGVVLVELLTGLKAVSAARVEEGRSLATHFLHSKEENQLFDILDERAKEGRREEIMAMAEIAWSCLHLNGKNRPTMKEVSCNLEGIQAEKQESSLFHEQMESRGCHSIDVFELDSDDFTSIISGR